jgi:hypothetical protein
MESAFLLIRFFPPPSSGPHILTRFNRPCARLAPYAGKTPVMQGMIGNVATPDIIPQLILCPVYKGINLYQLVAFIPFNGPDTESGNRLLPAKTANPGIESPERPLKRFNFPYSTTKLSVVYMLS